MSLKIKSVRKIGKKENKVKFVELETKDIQNIDTDWPVMKIQRLGDENMENMRPFMINSTQTLLINGEVLPKGLKRILQDRDQIKYEKQPDIVIFFEDKRKVLVELPLEIRERFYPYKQFKEGLTQTVYAVQDVLIPRQKFVLKQIKKKGKESIPSEAAIMMKLKHPNIVSLLKVYTCKQSSYVLIEYLEAVDLLNYIIKSPSGCLIETESKFCFYQIAQGIDYMHDLNIAHQDLKPENIFIRFINNRALCKIGDFGFSNYDTGTNDNVGTLIYSPPEKLVESSNEGFSSKKADMWSLGVILYCMICGKFPFFGSSDSSIRSAINNREIKFISTVWENVCLENFYILISFS